MPLSLAAMIALVSISGSAVAFLLLREYGRSETTPSNWRFTVADLGGFTQRGLIISSIFGLYLELLLIRWISSEIRIFAYFKNFVLIACFLGFGLGCYLCRRRVSLAALLLPIVLLTVLIKLAWTRLREMVTLVPNYLRVFAEVNIWGMPETPMNGQALGA